MGLILPQLTLNNEDAAPVINLVGLPTASSLTNVLIYNSASGQLSYTSSAAIGGGGSGITTLTGDVTATGAGSVTATLKANLKSGSFGITVDGNGSTITTGEKGYLAMPCDGNIIGYVVAVDQVGSCAIEIYKSTGTQFSAGTSSSIGTATLTSARISSGSLSNTFNQGNIITFGVTSATTVQRATVTLTYTKS